MKINLKYFVAYLGITLLMLYLVFRANELSIDLRLPISLNLFGGIALLISVLLSRQKRYPIEFERIANLTKSSFFQPPRKFIYSTGVFGILLIFSSISFFVIPGFHRRMPALVSRMTLSHLFLSGLFLALLYIIFDLLINKSQIETYHSVFVTIFLGALAGITISLAVASFFSFLFSLGSGGENIGEILLFFSFVSIFYGIGIGGIPSGIIGLLTGIVVGVIMYRLRKDLSDDKAVTIGLFASLGVALLAFLILVIVTDESVLQLLFTFLIFGIVYVLGSCAVSVLVYRNYFLNTPMHSEER